VDGIPANCVVWCTLGTITVLGYIRGRDREEKWVRIGLVWERIGHQNTSSV